MVSKSSLNFRCHLDFPEYETTSIFISCGVMSFGKFFFYKFMSVIKCVKQRSDEYISNEL